MFTGSPWRARAALAFFAAFFVVAGSAQAQETNVFRAKSLASQQLVAAAPPGGLHGNRGDHGPDGADRGPLRARRPRVRGREERPDQGVRQPHRPDADRLRRPRTRVHDFWDRGLLGLALDPNFATRPYVYVLYAYDADRRHRRRAGATTARRRRAPPRRLRGQRPAVALHGRRHRAGADRGLVPAVPEPLDRHLAFGADGALYVSGGDGASFNFADYGQDGTPLNPCGDPPGGVGGTHDAADGRGRRAAQPGRPHDRRPDRPRRRDPARRTRTPARRARQPERRQRRPEHAPHRRATGCATRSASRSGRARTRSGPATSAGTPGRRSTGS